MGYLIFYTLNARYYMQQKHQSPKNFHFMFCVGRMKIDILQEEFRLRKVKRLALLKVIYLLHHYIG